MATEHAPLIPSSGKPTFTEEIMELIKIGTMDADRITPLAAAFRVQLKSYKGIKAQPDTEAGKKRNS